MSDREQRQVDSRDTGLADFLHISFPGLKVRTDLFASFLKDGRRRGFEAYLRPVLRYEGAHAVVDGGPDLPEHKVVVMCSSDYLGFARHPEVIAAAAEALRMFGASVSSVPLIAGSTSLHKELEHSLSRFLGTEACVLFPSGHAANIGVVPAVCGPRDTVIVDKLVHYSILDGVRLSGARPRSFRHSDPDHLAEILSASPITSSRNALVIVEGVYGIDGDVAPLGDLVHVADRYGASLMVDEAHATGVVGPCGEGTSKEVSLTVPPMIVMGSLSKAFGSMGGFIATTSALADYLRYYARTIAFSVGLPAVSAAAGLHALTLLQRDPAIVRRLAANAAFFRDGLIQLGIKNAAKSASAIISAVVGDERVLRDVTRQLFRAGVFAEGLPFPAVPRGQERLRFRISVVHTEDDLARSLAIVAETFHSARLLPSVWSTASLSEVVADPPRPARQANLDGTPTSSDDCRAVAELAATSARSRGHFLPWLHANQYAAILGRQGAWTGQSRPSRLLLAQRSGRLVAAAMASIEAIPTIADGERTGVLGHVHSLPGEREALYAVLARGLEWLNHEAVATVLAPLQSPLQLLGGGVAMNPAPEHRPLFQPHVAPECAEILTDLGFHPMFTLPHALIPIDQALAALAAPPVPRLRIRILDRLQFGEEMARLLPIINATISRLWGCAPLGLDTLVAMATHLRDLVVSDLWHIAELDDRTVGFVGAFPDISAGLLEATGSGGTADIHNIEHAVSHARRGSVVWLAVDPPSGGQGVGAALLSSVCHRMAERGYTETWFHWELVDGPRSAANFLPPRSAIVDLVEDVIFGWRRSD
jgi:glycine C-acetyltransferase